MPKFSDIPQVTRESSYRINVPLDSLIETIDRYINKHHLNLNPDFQRDIVWTQQQQTAFIEHVLSGGAGSAGTNIIRFNKPKWPSSGDDEMVIVDGQQRLFACMQFLKNKIPAFGYLCNEYTDNIPWIGCDLVFTINNLKTKPEILKWYLEINVAGTPHTDEEIMKVQNMLNKN